MKNLKTLKNIVEKHGFEFKDEFGRANETNLEIAEATDLASIEKIREIIRSYGFACDWPPENWRGQEIYGDNTGLFLFLTIGHRVSGDNAMIEKGQIIARFQTSFNNNTFDELRRPRNENEKRLQELQQAINSASATIVSCTGSLCRY